MEVRKNDGGFFRAFGFRGRPTPESIRGDGELIFSVTHKSVVTPEQAVPLCQLIDKAAVKADELGIKVAGVNISRPGHRSTCA